MTLGEGGLAICFALTALLCLIGAGLTKDPAFEFHALLGTAASIAAVFAILNRFYAASNALAPREIDGRPNYNFGPIKLASGLAVFWGIVGFTVGLIIALQLAFPCSISTCRGPTSGGCGRCTPRR